MASSVIHMAVANEVNKVLKRNNDELLIGCIAPDISKHLGETKKMSHFEDDDGTSIPNMERFLDKYQSHLDNDFVMGYYIHLYTDYFWFKEFIPSVFDNDFITKLDGTKVKCNGNMLSLYIYNDYSNLNTRLLDEYDMDLSIFYNEKPELENIIEEIPMDKIQIIIDQASIIIENSKVHKDYVFNIEKIKEFIGYCVEKTIEKLKELNYI